MYVPTWGDLSPATMHFNEELTYGFLVQPSNALTNIAYVLVGLIMIIVYRREKNRALLTAFSASAVLVGVSSFLYHASNTFFFQVFDLSSMYLLSSLLLVLNVYRLTGVSGMKTGAFLFSGVFLVSLTLLLVIQGRVGAVIFGIEIAAVLALELVIGLKGKRKRTDYRGLMTALVLLAAAFIFWLLDFNHVLFPAKSHWIQGHGLWHVLNSLCFVFLYRYYRQFNLPERKPVRKQNLSRR